MRAASPARPAERRKRRALLPGRAAGWLVGAASTGGRVPRACSALPPESRRPGERGRRRRVQPSGLPRPGRPGGDMSFFGFGQSVDVDILLNDADSRKRAEHKTEDGKKDKYFLFYDGETVSGKVSLALKNPNKRLEHQGIKVEFIGQIGECRIHPTRSRSLPPPPCPGPRPCPPPQP